MTSSAAAVDPLRVVLVDDTPDLRDLLRLALQRIGDYTVVAEAGNGLDGVAAVTDHQPDLVLLDIAMPVMDGLEALPLIRQACPGAVIVMLSGFGATELTRRAIEAGADGYIQKGQSLRSLLNQVRAFVERAAGPAREPLAIPSPRPPQLDHLELAPFGFLHVRAGMVLRANREAQQLLGALAVADVALGTIAPGLARHLAQWQSHEGPVEVTLGDPPREVSVTVRRSGTDHLLYLQPAAGEEAALLRRAIGTAAHEIRGPVAVLMGAAETLVLHEAQMAEGDRERMLSAIDRQTRTLDNITADLLAAGEAQHGALSMQLEELDPVELVRSILDVDFALHVTGSSPGAPILADPLRFNQMLGNLCSNARKYGEAPFAVRVHTSGSGARIEVEDSGPGVPETFRPQLFQEYSRMPGSHERGTGLGLFVVRALAEAQGGSLSYHPREPHGSVFVLELPAPGMLAE